MEQSIKSAGNPPPENGSRGSVAYSSNRIREGGQFGGSKRPVATFSSSVVNAQKGKSLNKIQPGKGNAKIDIIRLKCMAKPLAKFRQQNALEPKWMEGEALNISFDMEDETDDAVLEQGDSNVVYVRRSKFEGRPSTVFFRYPKCCGIEEREDSRVEAVQKADLTYKIHGSEYKCIVNSLEYNGFRKCESGPEWKVYFDIKGTKLRKIEHMSRGQKINHFPGCWYIGRKDFLWRGVNKMRRSHPEAFNFLPVTYLLPADFERFQVAREKADKGQLWILKPAAAACGRGIKMVSKETKLRNRKEYLVSEYVSNPHLINGLKYDLRLYVLVTSYDPLRVYLFEEGLVRFATYEYNCKLKDIRKRFMHLTNFSVNKHSKRFVRNSRAEVDGEGSKWSLKALRRHFESVGIDAQQVFRRIEEVVVKTCISAEPNMLDLHSKSQEKRTCGFEIYGFDILLDSGLKPWLMEVNVCPSLSSSSPMDRKIKHTLLTDVLNLVGIEHSKEEKLKKKAKDKFPHEAIGRKIYSKNIKTIEELSYANCVEMLSPEDWLLLFESEEELDRLGHFKRIFPLAHNVATFQSLFELKRYNNIVLWRFLESQENFFDHLYKC